MHANLEIAQGPQPPFPLMNHNVSSYPRNVMSLIAAFKLPFKSLDLPDMALPFQHPPASNLPLVDK